MPGSTIEIKPGEHLEGVSSIRLPRHFALRGLVLELSRKCQLALAGVKDL